MPREIEVVAYNPEWRTLYKAEAQTITNVLGAEVFRIHHIGSTAIPGILAKPIIDIMVEVHDITKIEAFNPALMELGYQPRGENGIPGRRFFTKNTAGSRTHHIHIYQVEHQEIARHLKFRDYLLAHPEDVLAYSQLKEALVEKFRDDPTSYTNGKDEFVNKIDRRAEQ
jgi:GrpB-like predicted nucleotidyltransferase (UPF0157 family)